MDFTTEQYLAALAALGLDPETTVSVSLALNWVRVEHTDRPATSGPVAPAETA